MSAGAAVLACLFTVAAAFEVFRIGFFADDFHFLDVARRVPLLSALSGQYGVYPWYRPLSREIYFAVVALAGPYGVAVAHILSIACLAACAWLLFRIAAQLAGPAAAVAPALFVTYGFARFLTAWASGFQDLLATLFVLLAVSDVLERRRARAALWILLAPLAKETGFVALPLVMLAAVLCHGEDLRRRWVALDVLAFVMAAAIHLLVRAFWHSAGSAAVITSTAGGIVASLLQVMTAFVGGMPAGDAWTFASAIAAAAVIVLLWRAAPRGTPAHLRGATFAAAAAVIGLAPLVIASGLRLTIPHPYYGFPAVPWLSLLGACLAARLPSAAVRIALPLLVAWNILALGYRLPDLSRADAWNFRRWDWPESVRLSVISQRLASDVREALPSRPESLVVLYSLPVGTFFQTEDGPATRVALNDPTVRAYFINNPPGLVPREKLAILTFDFNRLKLGPDRDPLAKRTQDASTSLFLNQPAAAYAFASPADSIDYASVAASYQRAAARLLAQGPAGFRDELARMRLADSTGDAPARFARADFASLPGLESAEAAMFRNPLQAAAHGAFGESLLAHGYTVSAGAELRVASALDSSRFGDRRTLANTLEAAGYPREARLERARIPRGTGENPAR